MTMGEKIQLLRKKQNWSQETLAEKLSVSRQAVSLWERDESQPELDKLLKLAKIFSVTTDYLIDDSVTEIASPVSCGKTSFENNPKKKESHHITEFFLLATFLDAVGLLLSALLWKEYQRYVMLLPGLVLQLLALILAVGVFHWFDLPQSKNRMLRRWFAKNMWLLLPIPVLWLSRVIFSLLPFPYPGILPDMLSLIMYLTICPLTVRFLNKA